MGEIRTYILIAFFILISVGLYGQQNIDPKQMVGFGCYSGGEQTTPVHTISKLIQSKNYGKIAKLLTSKNTAEKYLATVTLVTLDSLGLYELNSGDIESISKIKNSFEQVSYCSGCVYFVSRNLYEMFKPKFLLPAKDWLDYELKID